MMNKVKSTPVRLYRGGGELGKALLKKVPIAAAGVLLFAAALVFTSCSNDSDSGETPTPKHAVTFSVEGGNGTLKAAVGGTLKAEVEGVEISSPYQAERNKTVVFTATPANEYYAVEKWTDGGTDIAAAGAHATYTHTVTADANIAVHFKTAPVDVYVTGTSDNKPYVWKNDAPTQLSAHEAAPDGVAPYAVHAQGKDVYIAGEEIKQGVARPLVWEKNGSLHWISAKRWSRAYDIAFYNGKTLVAGETSDGTDSGASITDISDTANPAVTFLYKKTPPISHAEAVALCVGSGTLYAAGNKYNSNTYKYTVFLWTKPDEGSVSEMELGPQGEADYSYDVCTAGASVYVAAGRLWKVDGETVTQITVPESKGGYALCVREGTVYAAGWTNTGRAAVWKIEGTSASLYATLSTNVGNVYALCAAGGDLYVAGTVYDGGLYKPVWWHIATGGTVTEHKLGTEKGEARGICVTAQE